VQFSNNDLTLIDDMN